MHDMKLIKDLRVILINALDGIIVTMHECNKKMKAPQFLSKCRMKS